MHTLMVYPISSRKEQIHLKWLNYSKSVRKFEQAALQNEMYNLNFIVLFV